MLYRLCIEGKNLKSRSQGQRDGSNLLIQYILWGPTNDRPPNRGERDCLATALFVAFLAGFYAKLFSHVTKKCA